MEPGGRCSACGVARPRAELLDRIGAHQCETLAGAPKRAPRCAECVLAGMADGLRHHGGVRCPWCARLVPYAPHLARAPGVRAGHTRVVLTAKARACAARLPPALRDVWRRGSARFALGMAGVPTRRCSRGHLTAGAPIGRPCASAGCAEPAPAPRGPAYLAAASQIAAAAGAAAAIACPLCDAPVPMERGACRKTSCPTCAAFFCCGCDAVIPPGRRLEDVCARYAAARVLGVGDVGDA